MILELEYWFKVEHLCTLVLRLCTKSLQQCIFLHFIQFDSILGLQQVCKEAEFNWNTICLSCNIHLVCCFSLYLSNESVPLWAELLFNISENLHRNHSDLLAMHYTHWIVAERNEAASWNRADIGDRLLLMILAEIEVFRWVDNRAKRLL